MAPRELDRANRFLLSVYNLKSRLAGRLLSDLLRLSFNYWTRCPAFTLVLVFMAILLSSLILGSSLQSPARALMSCLVTAASHRSRYVHSGFHVGLGFHGCVPFLFDSLASLRSPRCLNELFGDVSG
jgi:hypothetical protein